MIPTVIAHCPDLGRDIRPLIGRLPGVRVFEGTRLPEGQDGAVFSHHSIVELAKVQGWPCVWVLEDDCSFTPSFSLAQWQADTVWMLQQGYQVLTGGCIAAANPRLVRRGLFAVDRFKSAHCVVYAASAYDTVLIAGPPLDLQLGRLGLKCLMTYPFAAVQAPSFSGLLNRQVDYRPRYTRYEAELEALAQVKP